MNREIEKKETKESKEIVKNIKRIPIYFIEPKKTDVLIGKKMSNIDITEFKFNETSNSSYNKSSKEFVKEYVFSHKKNPKLLLKGRENAQDSKYILMEYKPKQQKIEIMPANRWVNLMKTFEYRVEKNDKNEKEKSTLDINEEKRKNRLKNLNELQKMLFNKGYIKKNKNTRRGPKKKINSSDDKNDNEDGFAVFGENGFKEDSHSSEKSLELEEQEKSDYDEKNKEIFGIKENTKAKEENITPKKNYSDDNDENENENDCLESYSSEEEQLTENDNALFENLQNMKSPKAKRNEEQSLKNSELADSLVNLLGKVSRMTYQDIFGNLLKQYPTEILENELDKLLDLKAGHFCEDHNGETYYFLK